MEEGIWAVIDLCTSADAAYLLRGIALYRSLIRHVPDFRLWFLGYDDVVILALQSLSLPRVEIIPLDELASAFPQLAIARESQTPPAFYVTCKPFLLKYVQEREPGVRSVSYLDADLCFFAPPRDLDEWLTRASVLLSPHHIPANRPELLLYGEHNAGFVTFSSDSIGRECLTWWCEKVIERCAEDLPNGFYFEQRYLDELPRRFSRVMSIDNPAYNVAPWNLGTHHLSVQGDHVHVNGIPLDFYHFNAVRAIFAWLYDCGLGPYYSGSVSLIKRHLYRPYLDELDLVRHRLGSLGFRTPLGASNVRFGRSEPAALTLLKRLPTPHSLMIHRRATRIEPSSPEDRRRPEFFEKRPGR